MNSTGVRKIMSNSSTVRRYYSMVPALRISNSSWPHPLTLYIISAGYNRWISINLEANSRHCAAIILRLLGSFLIFGSGSRFWATQTMSNTLMAKWSVSSDYLSLTDKLIRISSTIFWRSSMICWGGSWNWTASWSLRVLSDSVYERVKLSSWVRDISNGFDSSFL